GFLVEKRLLLPHLQNTVHVTYRLLRGDGVLRLKLRPAVHFRPHEGPVGGAVGAPYVLTAVEDRYELTAGGAGELSASREPRGGPLAEMPPLRMRLLGRRGTFTIDGRRTPALLYRLEASRGYDSVGELWSPGHFRVDLSNDAEATLIASTEA